MRRGTARARALTLALRAAARRACKRADHFPIIPNASPSLAASVGPPLGASGSVRIGPVTSFDSAKEMGHGQHDVIAFLSGASDGYCVVATPERFAGTCTHVATMATLRCPSCGRRWVHCLCTRTGVILERGLPPCAEQPAESERVSRRALGAVCGSASLTALLAGVLLQRQRGLLLALLTSAAFCLVWQAVNPPHHAIGLERTHVRHVGS